MKTKLQTLRSLPTGSQQVVPAGSICGVVIGRVIVPLLLLKNIFILKIFMVLTENNIPHDKVILPLLLHK